MDREQLLDQAGQLRAGAARIRERSAQVRAEGRRLCLVSDALIQLDRRYRQEAERRLLQDVYLDVIADEVQDPHAKQGGDTARSRSRAQPITNSALKGARARAGQRGDAGGYPGQPRV